MRLKKSTTKYVKINSFGEVIVIRRPKRKNNKTKIPGFTKERRDAYLIQYPFCMICLSTRDLMVDHCHVTRKVRAVLCGPCNSGLGLFKDDPSLLRAAAEYIEFFKKRNGA